MTNDLITRAREALEHATPGEWVVSNGYVRSPSGYLNVGKRTAGVADCRLVNGDNDATLIALSPDLARLALAAEELAEAAKTLTSRKPSPVTGGRMVLEVDLIALEKALAAFEAIAKGEQP